MDAEAADPRAALECLRHGAGSETAIVWVGRGPALSQLRDALGPGPALFRAIAGAGAEDRKGLTVLCPEAGAPTASLITVARLLERIGTVEVVPEDMVDAAIAVTSSSVGFLALAMEGIEDGAVEAGLPRDAARAFVRQTALTTALLLQAHPGSPADLKDQVASPGGTTIAGLAALEDRAVRGAYIRAVEQASGKDRTSRDVGGSPVIE
jgi:pyrroline-5-carboxylate reductase